MLKFLHKILYEEHSYDHGSTRRYDRYGDFFVSKLVSMQSKIIFIKFERTMKKNQGRSAKS